jgi:hypothetical protein
LLELQTEGYIHITDADGIKFSITLEGLEYAITLAEDEGKKVGLRN